MIGLKKDWQKNKTEVKKKVKRVKENGKMKE